MSDEDVENRSEWLFTRIHRRGRFAMGSGFAGTRMSGMAHNDLFVPDGAGGIATETNHSGGIQGGISNAMPIELAMAFKPTATVFKEQRTVNAAGEATTIKPRGRHDPCVLPRAEQETTVDTAFTVSATH